MHVIWKVPLELTMVVELVKDQSPFGHSLRLLVGLSCKPLSYLRQLCPPEQVWGAYRLEMKVYIFT